jgi:hypothetical protein
LRLDASFNARFAVIAKLLEEQAIEVESLAARLRTLGCIDQADQTARMARSLAVVSRSLTNKSSEGLELFFGIGTPSTDMEFAGQGQDGARQPLPWVKNL